MIFDIALLIIMLICIYRGFSKGVLRTVLGIVGIAAAFILASLFSSYENCCTVYDSLLHDRIYPHIESAVDTAKEKAIERLDSELRDSVRSVIDESFGGSEILSAAAGKLLDNTDKVREALPQIAELLGIDVRTLLTNPAIRGKIEEAADTYSSVAADRINEKLPFGIKVTPDQVSEIMKDEEAEQTIIYEFFGISSPDAKVSGAAEYIEKKIIRPAAVRVLGAIIWALTFAAVNLVIGIIFSVIMILRRIEPLKACDSVLGGVLGAALGAALVTACCVIITLVIRTTGGTEHLNEKIISDTAVFRYIYGLVSGMV